MLAVLLLGGYLTYNTLSDKAETVKTLTFTVSYPYPYFVKAVDVFNKANNSVKVKLVNFSTTYNSTALTGTDKVEVADKEDKRVDLAWEEFEKIVNTGLMSGGGYDIICMSGLDYKKYVDKDFLADYDELKKANESFSIDNYNSRILDLYRIKGRLYTMPLGYIIFPIAADGEVLEKLNMEIDSRKWTWNDFYNIAHQIANADKNATGGKLAMAEYNPVDLLLQAFWGSYDIFVDHEKREANFNTNTFKELLNLCKSFTSSELLNQDADWKSSYAQKADKVVFNSIAVAGFDIRMYKNAYKQLMLLNPPSVDGAHGRVRCYSNNLYAINNNSKLKNEALEFIKLLLSEEMQVSREYNGLGLFPVNNSASNKLRETPLMFVNEAFDRYSHIKLDDYDLKVIDNYIDSIDGISYHDGNVSKIILSTVGDFFQGKKTAEEIADIIQRKVTIYLNE